MRGCFPLSAELGEGDGTGRVYCKIMHGVNACFSPLSVLICLKVEMALEIGDECLLEFPNGTFQSSQNYDTFLFCLQGFFHSDGAW